MQKEEVLRGVSRKNPVVSFFRDNTFENLMVESDNEEETTERESLSTS